MLEPQLLTAHILLSKVRPTNEKYKIFLLFCKSCEMSLFVIYIYSMATHKAGGSTTNGRDSQSKRLGVKIFGGQKITTGSIIIRQRGTRYKLGTNVGLGRDHTIFAMENGTVFFHRGRDNRVFVSVKA